ncbi:hypothetical protein CICLE_v10005883mg [Citrus x clementina]|uniref:X8 domain-containing protein n=1 Tax=Citrus clementina TaxID=85681 RepID=V4U4P7_CITCL|nr:hypothetical protein CICLE_v10005883mg [Citrus x clementina]
MASHQNLTLLSFTIIFSCMNMIMLNVMAANVPVEGTGNSTWCVARSDASNQVLQTALDYACGTGADCTPIQPNGLCYLPNTIQAHASYAFNSYFQRKGMAPGSCDFSGTATIAKTDPSYGSCMYPSSLRYVLFFPCFVKIKKVNQLDIFLLFGSVYICFFIFKLLGIFLSHHLIFCS